MRLLLFGLFSATIITHAACAAETDSASPAPPISVQSGDWPWWRGPGRDGAAAADQEPPLSWSNQKNVIWTAAIAGRGHGSPTIVGEQVFLATCDHRQESQLVLCYDRQSGKKLWQTVVHQGGIAEKSNKKASQASSTVACDGERLFINFLNRDAVYTTALSRDGKQLWQTKISDYVVHQGYGSSPCLYGPLVIVSADNKGGGAIAALDRTTGKIAWRHDRPAKPNYASPIVLHVAGRDQLVFTGCDLIASYEPLTGKKLWETEGATTECVTSTVTCGELVFSSGGYPRNHVSAVRGDGSSDLVWENTTRVYVPSMLVRDGYLYAVADAGTAICWKCDTGEEMWKGRLGGTFSASPVLVGDKIYAVNEAGEAFIFKADPQSFELIAENKLPGEVMATPAICGGRIYLRIAEQINDQRQEFLYCLGEGE